MTNRDSSGGVALKATSSKGEAHGSPGTLVLELLDWLSRKPRTHRETIETWGSHCPRITPWEDAQESGLVEVARSRETNGRLAVVLTRWGQAALAVKPQARSQSPQTQAHDPWRSGVPPTPPHSPESSRPRSTARRTRSVRPETPSLA